MMRRIGGLSVASKLLVVGLALGLVGCDSEASDLAEWTVTDHDQAEPPKRRAMGPVTPRTHAPPSQRNQVIDVTWLKQCASCHGKKGKGDGPQSLMVKAKDLTPMGWQASVTDEQLFKVIKEGREKMPAFNLPDSIVQGLVAHVRSLAETPREKEHGEEGPLPDAPAAPAGAATGMPPVNASTEGKAAPANASTKAAPASSQPGVNAPASAAPTPAAPASERPAPGH